MKSNGRRVDRLTRGISLSTDKNTISILSEISRCWYDDGHLNPDQRDYLVDVLRELRPKSCLEIGFASGRSTVTTLVAAQPDILISVDLSLDYVPGARAHADLLQDAFPNRESSRATLSKC